MHVKVFCKIISRIFLAIKGRSRKFIPTKNLKSGHSLKFVLVKYLEMSHLQKFIPKISWFFLLAKVSSVKVSSFKVVKMINNSIQQNNGNWAGFTIQTIYLVDILLFLHDVLIIMYIVLVW